LPPDVIFYGKNNQISFQLALRPRPRWGSSQRSPRFPSWIQGVLLLREGGEKRKTKEKWGREEGKWKARRKRDIPPPLG